MLDLVRTRLASRGRVVDFLRFVGRHARRWNTCRPGVGTGQREVTARSWRWWVSLALESLDSCYEFTQISRTDGMAQVLESLVQSSYGKAHSLSYLLSELLKGYLQIEALEDDRTRSGGRRSPAKLLALDAQPGGHAALCLFCF